MRDTAGHRVLWLWTAPELIVLFAGGCLLAASLVGDVPAFAADISSISWPLRATALAFLAVELLIPLWVSIDLHRHTSGVDPLWIHVTAMPLLNLFGLVAYLQVRRRTHSPPQAPEGSPRH